MIDETLIKSFFILIACVAGIGGLFFFLKKISRKVRASSDTIGMEILSRLSLMPKNHLFIVKAGEKTLLLGVSEKNISILADLTDEETASLSSKTSIRKMNKAIAKNKIPSGFENITSDLESLTFSSFLKSTFSKS